MKKLSCPVGQILVKRGPICVKTKGSEKKCSDLGSSECKEIKGCTWRSGAEYCAKDQGAPGKGEKIIKSNLSGYSLTDIFNDAGVRLHKKEEGKIKARKLGEGDVIKSMSMNNCKIVGSWMKNNVDKWNEKGKNPKISGKGKFQSIEVLMKRTNPEKSKKIAKCREVVSQALRELPSTSRK